MSRFWARVCKQTGDYAFVISEDDTHPTDHGSPTEGFKYKLLPREPTEFDVFENGKLKRCPDRVKELGEISLQTKLQTMSRAEFLDFIMQEVDRRIAAGMKMK